MWSPYLESLPSVFLRSLYPFFWVYTTSFVYLQVSRATFEDCIGLPWTDQTEILTAIRDGTIRDLYISTFKIENCGIPEVYPPDQLTHMVKNLVRLKEGMATFCYFIKMLCYEEQTAELSAANIESITGRNILTELNTLELFEVARCVVPGNILFGLDADEEGMNARY